MILVLSILTFTFPPCTNTCFESTLKVAVRLYMSPHGQGSVNFLGVMQEKRLRGNGWEMIVELSKMSLRLVDCASLSVFHVKQKEKWTTVHFIHKFCSAKCDRESECLCKIEHFPAFFVPVDSDSNPISDLNVIIIFCVGGKKARKKTTTFEWCFKHWMKIWSKKWHISASRSWCITMHWWLFHHHLFLIFWLESSTSYWLYCNSSQTYFTYLCQQTKCLLSHNPLIISYTTSCRALFHGCYSCDLSKVVSGFPYAGCGLKGIYWQELLECHGTRQHPLQAGR